MAIDKMTHLTMLLDELTMVKEELGLLNAKKRELTEEIAKEMPERKMEIGDHGVIERSYASNKKWDSDSLIPVLVARALDDRIVDKSTGEIEREATAVARVLKSCAGIGYWRMTELKEYGVEPDEYYETSSKRASLRFY